MVELARTSRGHIRQPAQRRPVFCRDVDSGNSTSMAALQIMHGAAMAPPRWLEATLARPRRPPRLLAPHAASKPLLPPTTQAALRVAAARGATGPAVVLRALLSAPQLVLPPSTCSRHAAGAHSTMATDAAPAGAPTRKFQARRVTRLLACSKTTWEVDTSTLG